MADMVNIIAHMLNISMLKERFSLSSLSSFLDVIYTLFPAEILTVCVCAFRLLA